MPRPCILQILIADQDKRRPSVPNLSCVFGPSPEHSISKRFFIRTVLRVSSPACPSVFHTAFPHQHPPDHGSTIQQRIQSATAQRCGRWGPLTQVRLQYQLDCTNLAFLILDGYLTNSVRTGTSYGRGLVEASRSYRRFPVTAETPTIQHLVHTIALAFSNLSKL